MSRVCPIGRKFLINGMVDLCYPIAPRTNDEALIRALSEAVQLIHQFVLTKDCARFVSVLAALRSDDLRKL